MTSLTTMRSSAPSDVPNIRQEVPSPGHLVSILQGSAGFAGVPRSVGVFHLRYAFIAFKSTQVTLLVRIGRILDADQLPMVLCHLVVSVHIVNPVYHWEEFHASPSAPA